jgi:adenine-specific DNA-methyltransferase
MLQELFYLRMCLFAAQSLDSISAYQRKLEIIQNNIYGVDQDPFAANIARLRLWLSLAVEFEGEIPLALPNLDFKIEIGDSLIAPNPRGAAQQAFRGELIGQFREAKDRFIYMHGGEKISLRRHIAEIKEQISQWTHQGDTVYGFDWDVEFAEVFSDGGFDIVLANPPYVRADAQFKHLIDDEEARQAAIAQWKDYRAMLLSSGIFQTLYEKWDLYLPFLERAYYLMRPEGRMVFIISDAYNAAKYTRKSHEFFLENAKVVRLDFCSDISLFKAGISNTILHFAKNQPTKTDIPLRVRRWGEKQDDFEKNSEVLPASPQLEMGINTFKPQTIEQQTIKESINLNNLCYISYGLRANADDRFWQGEFTTDDCLSKIKDNEHPKPFVQGKDLIKWWAYRVYYLEWGTQRAPKKFSRPTFSELHAAKEKLIAVRTPGAEPKVIYDNSQLHFDASCVGFVPWHLLKGVMNKSISKAAKYRGQAPGGDREKREISSQEFHIKYLLAILNSRFSREWLAG